AALAGAIRRRHAGQRAEAALATLHAALRGEVAGEPVGRALNEVISLHETRAVEPLLALLRQSNFGDPDFCLPLAELGDERVVDPLLGVVREGPTLNRFLTGAGAMLGLALHYMNAEASRRSNARGVAIDSLKLLAERLDLRLPAEPFVVALRDPLPHVRQRAARMLSILGGREALAGLRTAIHDPDEAPRGAIALRLGELSDIAAIAPLTEMLRDPSPRVQENARYAIRHLTTRGEVAP